MFVIANRDISCLCFTWHMSLCFTKNPKYMRIRIFVIRSRYDLCGVCVPMLSDCSEPMPSHPHILHAPGQHSSPPAIHSPLTSVSNHTTKQPLQQQQHNLSFQLSFHVTTIKNVCMWNICSARNFVFYFSL